jgi:hypothetical protein
MNDNKPASGSDQVAIIVALVIGTFIWIANPVPFFGLGPLQAFLSDEYYLRTIDQLRQAGMLRPFSQVFVIMEIQAVLLLGLAVAAYVCRSKRLALLYMALVIVLSIIPFLRFVSELQQAH